MSKEVFKLVEDYGEVCIDHFLQEGVLKEIPIVGTAFNTIKICKDIRDMIFVEKLKSFLEAVDKDSRWKEKYSDPSECQKISKHLLYIIDQCDDDQKLRLIGLGFNRFVKNEISHDEYFYIVEMISRAHYPFLEVLMNLDSSDYRFVNDGSVYDNNAIAHLFNIGALDYDGQTVATFDANGKGKPGAMILSVNGYGQFIKSLMEENNKTKEP